MPEQTIANATTQKTIHFLHIGKAAGSQIKHLANQVNAAQTAWRIKKYPHHVDLKDLPDREPYFFSIRHPLSRFTSGFYSRKRKGQPRLLVEWTAHEKRAFKAFEHANDLAEALFEDSPRGANAFYAINSMNHTAKGQVDWFFKRGFLFDIRPPLWVIRQEHFAADWAQFLDRIGLARYLPPTEDDTRAHRNDYSNVPPLSDRAKENLRRWYCQDIEFYKRCEEWIERQRD